MHSPSGTQNLGVQGTLSGPPVAVSAGLGYYLVRERLNRVYKLSLGVMGIVADRYSSRHQHPLPDPPVIDAGSFPPR